MTKFPTVSEWDGMSVKIKRIHAAWELSEATRSANPDHDPLSPNEERALEMVAEAFGLDALYKTRIDGLQHWNDELRRRLSVFYRDAAS